MKYIFNVKDFDIDFSISLKRILTALDLFHADKEEKSALRTIILDELNNLKRKIIV